jgi:F420-dependent oxidoreductase-like protein
MSEQNVIGVSVTASNAQAAIDRIVHLDEMGVGCAWLTSSGGGGEAVTVLAAAAAVTDEIKLGTSIVQTWSRHPVTLVQQIQVIDSLAPGRFRIGVGPSHRAGMISTFGVDFRAPIGHLREYLQILRSLMHTGAVEFEGRWYSANSSIANPIDVPIMASALRPGAFETCGELSDGAISWVCPHFYLRDTAVPAMTRGAESAGRDVPPLIAHAPVCVTDDLDAARDGVRTRLGYFPANPFYANMFAEAGFADTPESGWTNEMLDEVLIAGDEATVAERIQTIFDWGASELLATPIPAGDDPDATEERTLNLLAEVQKG